MCRYARDRAQLKQVDAAKRLGISFQLLSDIENGRRSATSPTLHAMAELYNIPIVGLERKRWTP